MFGDLMGDLTQKQESLKATLKEIKVEEDMQGIVIEANAARIVENISINDSSLLSDQEQLEDLLLVAFNNINAKITETEMLESQKLMQDILPGGLDSLFN
jgi:DNA-binding protein YbaB